MPHDRLRTSSKVRSLYTGEPISNAYQELAVNGPQAEPIPDPSPAQACLEAAFLEEVGRLDPDLWFAGDPPFGIKSVTPRRDELIVRVPRAFLPEVIAAVLPHAEDPHVDVSEIYGIPGLRPLVSSGRVILSRPGQSGRIVIPVDAATWRRACAVALSEYSDLPHVLWREHPTHWHPQEVAYVEMWPEDFTIGGPHRSGHLFLARFLRRFRALSLEPHAGWFDLWTNYFKGRLSIELECAQGPTHKQYLARLLDPVFGLGTHTEPDENCECDTPGEHCYDITVLDNRLPGCELHLRRSHLNGWDEVPPHKFKMSTVQRRLTRFAKHGYACRHRTEEFGFGADSYSQHNTTDPGI